MIVKTTDFNVDRIKRSIEDIGFRPSVVGGKLIVNGYEIPYSSLKWVFERYGTFRLDKNLPMSFKSSNIYDIKIGNSTYSYKKDRLVNADIFLKNGKPHSLNGPAKKSGNLEVYMREGKLHRVEGPALTSSSGKEVYALNGKLYSLIDAIPKFLSKTTSTFITKHNGHKVHTCYWKDYKHIRIGNHRWLLKKSKNKTSKEIQRQFLLTSLYKEQANYDIVKYSAPNQVYEDIDTVIKALAENASIETNASNSIFSGYVDGELIKISLFLDKNEMSFVHHTKDGKASAILTERLDGIIEAKDNMSKINVNALKDIENLLSDLFTPNSEHVYGVNVPDEIFKKSLYSIKDKSYCWKDENNKLHCPDENIPAKIYPDGTMEFYDHGVLHRIHGPAIANVLDKNKKEYYLHGKKVSLDEFIHYSSTDKQIKFTKDGILHRKSGPALIDFNFDPPREERWVSGTKLKGKEYQPMIDKTLDSNEENGWVITKEKEPDLIDNYIDEPTDEIDIGDLFEESRSQQIFSGMKTGYKKGFVDGSTEMIAKKVVEVSPLETNQELAAKILQIMLLTLSAETVNAIPENFLEKLNLDVYEQQELATFFHSLSGEKIGRNLTNLTTEFVLPYLKDFITSFSLEEMVELAEEYEAKQEEQKEVTLEELINNSKDQAEQVVEEEKVEEVEYAVK